MNLGQLAQAARPVNDDDWASERQTDAENTFFDAVKALLPDDEFARLEDFCLCHATTDEMIDEALRMVKRHG